ncbi:45859_t:CDS:2, partial [Gigaspora margarita]
MKEPEIDNIIKKYLATPLKMQAHFRSTASSQQKLPEISKVQKTPPQIPQTFDVEEIQSNASAQKQAADSKVAVKKKIKELEAVYNFTNDLQLHYDLYVRITNLKSELQEHKNKLHKLKKNAKYQSKCRFKKIKVLEEEQVYGSADARRRKEAVKVRIINYLRENLEKNYGIYMSRMTLNNYLLSRQLNSIAAKAHHHPAWIAIAGVSHNETKDYSDRHYCLASVKGARQFARTFPNFSVIISQDDKAKIGLGILAVGRTFRTLQSVSELVQLPDHDFACRNSQKLILSVYLMIKPNEENDDLLTGQ